MPSFLQEIPSHTVVRTETTDDENEDSNRRNRSKQRRRTSKRNAGDSQSAGRKEAAREFPLDNEAPCEWQGLSNCGGGDYPVLGCLEGKQEARHHGPDKDVHNNTVGNVHRICHYCHYRWHAKNDPTYDWNRGVYPPHGPRPFNEAEQKQQALDYMRYLTTGRRAKKLKELD